LPYWDEYKLPQEDTKLDMEPESHKGASKDAETKNTQNNISSTFLGTELLFSPRK
jgi:hypothetical protein